MSFIMSYVFYPFCFFKKEIQLKYTKSSKYSPKIITIIDMRRLNTYRNNRAEKTACPHEFDRVEVCLMHHARHFKILQKFNKNPHERWVNHTQNYNCLKTTEFAASNLSLTNNTRLFTPIKHSIWNQRNQFQFEF